MVTLMPRFPFSLNMWAMLVSKTRQSLFCMAAVTPSWMLRGVASHNIRRPCPFNSRRYWNCSACFRVPISWTTAKNCWCPSCFSWKKKDCQWREHKSTWRVRVTFGYNIHILGFKIFLSRLQDSYQTFPEIFRFDSQRLTFTMKQWNSTVTRHSNVTETLV